MENATCRNSQDTPRFLYQNKQALLRSAAIGEEVSIEILGGDSVTGTLEEISSKGVTIQTETDRRLIPMDQILLLKRKRSGPVALKQDAGRFFKQAKAVMNTQGLSIPVQYAETFERILPYSTNQALAALFQRRSTRGIPTMNQKTKLAVMAELELVFRRVGGLEQDEILAARAFVHFAARDYTHGLAELLKVCLPASNQDSLYCLLPLACYCADLRQQPLAHYWLSHFFRYFTPDTDENDRQLIDPVWLYYLKCAVSRNCYDDLIPKLEALFREHPKTALHSVAFMYFLQNAFDMGQQLLCEAQSDVRMITEDQFRTYCIPLSSSPFDEEHFGSFYRFRMRMNEILSSGLYQSYTDNPNADLIGFVYEYIPDSGYCRVLGYDLMIYFWHFDRSLSAGGNQSQYLRNAIEEQMCSMQPVEDEKPVRIRFRATSGKYANQGYTITDVQLE